MQHRTRHAPHALRIELAGAHMLLRILEAARVQAADDLHSALQPRVRVQQVQRALVDVAALPG